MTPSKPKNTKHDPTPKPLEPRTIGEIFAARCNSHIVESAAELLNTAKPGERWLCVTDNGEDAFAKFYQRANHKNRKPTGDGQALMIGFEAGSGPSAVVSFPRRDPETLQGHNITGVWLDCDVDTLTRNEVAVLLTSIQRQQAVSVQPSSTVKFIMPPMGNGSSFDFKVQPGTTFVTPPITTGQDRADADAGAMASLDGYERRALSGPGAAAGETRRVHAMRNKAPARPRRPSLWLLSFVGWIVMILVLIPCASAWLMLDQVETKTAAGYIIEDSTTGELHNVTGFALAFSSVAMWAVLSFLYTPAHLFATGVAYAVRSMTRSASGRK